MRLRIGMLVMCILAAAYAASGVHLVVTKDVWWDTARGVFRIVFGTILILVSIVGAMRGKQENREPDIAAEQSAKSE